MVLAMADTDLISHKAAQGVDRRPADYTAELVALLGCSVLLLVTIGLALMLDSFAP
jgi:hypothetical protein